MVGGTHYYIETILWDFLLTSGEDVLYPGEALRFGGTDPKEEADDEVSPDESKKQRLDEDLLTQAEIPIQQLQEMDPVEARAKLDRMNNK
ncbi:Hypothetical predicted protein, partial [Olea europaea subsp. europaea]